MYYLQSAQIITNILFIACKILSGNSGVHNKL